MKSFNDIKRVFFVTGSEEEAKTLMVQDIEDDVCFVALTHDSDKLYGITRISSTVGNRVCEICGLERKLILSGMFPNLTGNIMPEFKMVRADIAGLLWSLKDPDAPNLGIKR